MERLHKDHKVLIIVLLVGLLDGLIFVLLMPPWQHYDEPNHFEYAWLIANRGKLPQMGDYDQEMRRQTATSMIEHNFFKGMDFLPDLESANQPIWIGTYSQLADPPLYYLLGSIPLRLPVVDITTQLYLVRIVSLFLYLVSIFAAWGIMTEITSVGNPLRLLVPLTLALFPGFSDVMTAVNNTAAATAFFSLCLWGCVRLLVKGVSVINVLWSATTATLCMFTSVTAYFAVPIFLISLFLAFFHGRGRVLAWGVLCLAGIVGAILLLERGDAGSWYRSTLQELPLRVKDSGAVIGDYIFQVDANGEVSPAWLVPTFQSIGNDIPAGKYTFGAWMWANQPIRVQTPSVGVGTTLTFNTVELGTAPGYFAFPVLVEKDGLRTWISLAPKAAPAQQGLIYYDGLVLAEGEYPIHQEPMYANAQGQGGNWGGKPFKNLIRNASAEKDGLRLNVLLDRIVAKLLPDNILPSLLLTYITDWQGAHWHYGAVGNNLLRSFWGAFGWGHVPLLSEKMYSLLTFVTIMAVVGSGIRLAMVALKKWNIPLPRQFTWDIILLFTIVLVLIWGSASIRGAIYLASPQFYIPVARYAFPAIMPTGLILAGGWMFLLSIPFALFKRWNQHPQIPAGWIYIVSLLCINLYALWSILVYYRL